MAKTKTVWKVVRYGRQTGGRYSAIVDLHRGGIFYAAPLRPTVAPPGTKLLAFRRKKDAEMFLGTEDIFNGEIWKAEAKDVQKVAQVCSLWHWGLNSFVWFWKELGSGYHTQEAPTGTVSCSELTLVKQVA